MPGTVAARLRGTRHTGDHRGRPGGSEHLRRLRRLFGRFEFVTTNGFGSHIAYAAAAGAKVSVFGPYAEFPCPGSA